LLNVNLNDVTDITAEDVLYLRLSAKDLQSLREDNKRKPNVGVIVAAASIISFGLLMLMLLLMVWRNKFKWWVCHYDTQVAVEL
jgi:hypothetical protein